VFFGLVTHLLHHQTGDLSFLIDDMAQPISPIQSNPNHHETLRAIFTSADSFTTFHDFAADAIKASISPVCTFSPAN
jgi:hypothetical protein